MLVGDSSDLGGRGGDVGGLNEDKLSPAPEMDGASPPADGTYGDDRLSSLYTGLVTARCEVAGGVAGTLDAGIRGKSTT